MSAGRRTQTDPPRPSRPSVWSPWAALVLGVVVTFVAVMIGGWPPDGPSKEPAPTPPAPTAKPLSTPTQVVGIAPPAPKGNDSSISKKPLALILEDTEPGATSREGLAMIGVVRGSPQTYVGGALLANGARLVEIHRDFVVLEKDGRTARLLKIDSKEAASQESRSGNAVLTIGGTAKTEPAIESYHETLTDFIRPSPVYEGQTMLGYEVYPGERAAAFAQMGLKPADVILTLNDLPLREPASAWDTLRQLAEGAVLRATVKRGKEIHELTLDGALIARAQPETAIVQTGPASAH